LTGALRVVALLGCVFLVALVLRVRSEHSDRLEAARAAEGAEKGVLLAESARWTWPIGDERPERLEEALELAEGLRSDNPEGARAIAEEVRATLYATRVGRPGHPGTLSRANEMITDLLSARDGLSEGEKQALAAQYEKYDGPSTGAAAGSSAGFCLWLFGLWLSARERGKRRIASFALAGLGLALFLGFLAVA